MNVSPTHKHRKVNGNRQSLKKQFLRSLRMEHLERRELMAADVVAETPFHNGLIPNDVDGDFQVSPLDALMVINSLNAVGAGALAGRTPPNARTGLIDTDADNVLSPLDVLSVINTLNRGEGAGSARVEISYEFYRVNADGTAGNVIPDPTPNDGIKNVQINSGELFIVRTLMEDVRNNRTGVFSAYHDFNYTNVEQGVTDERMELQWSDYNFLQIKMENLGTEKEPEIARLSGSFKLKYGSEVTQAIDIALTNNRVDVKKTAENIQSAIEKLPSIGSGNSRVLFTLGGSFLGYRFDITFRNQRARMDMPTPTIVDQNLSVDAGSVPLMTIDDVLNPDASKTDAVRGANDYTYGARNADDAANQSLYVNGMGGALSAISGVPEGRRIKVLGGFVNKFDPPDSITKIVDTTFRAAKAGEVMLQGTLSPLPTVVDPTAKNLGIAFGGSSSYVTDPAQASFGKYFVNIVDRLTATNNSYPQNEDETKTYPVAEDDSARDPGVTFGIVGVSTPTNNAGTVQFVNGTKSITFVPTKDFFGQTSFTYTIRSSQNDEKTATVSLTINPVNDGPIVIPGGLAYNASEDQASPLVIASTDIFRPGPQNEIDAPQSQTIASLAIDQPVTGFSINAAGSLSYLPPKDFFGTVSVVVIGTDSGSGTSPNVNSTKATVTVTVAPVNDQPVTVKEKFEFTLTEGTARTIPVSDLFTAGPANEIAPPQNQTVTLQVIDPKPSGAQLIASINNAGQLVLAPQGDFFTAPNNPVLVVVQGTDSGSGVAPNANTTVTTLTITINNVNDAPIANPDSGADFSVIALAGSQSLDVLKNDSAGPGGESEPILVDSVSAVEPSNFGTVTIAQDRKSILFTPTVSVDGTFPKTATFTYIIKDVPTAGSGQALTSQSAKVTVTILPPASPYALDDQETINEDAGEVFFDVLANDIVKQGVTPAATKFFTNNQPNVLEATPDLVKSIIVDTTANKIKFEANPNRFGTVKFTYEMDSSVQEGTNQRKTATATIIVNAVNDAPVAVDKPLEMDEDGGPLTVNVSALNLSSGAFENDSLVFVSPTLTDPSVGTLRFTAGSNSFVYEPAKDFFGDALVKYKVRDNGTPPAESNEATITIKVKPVNDPPIATSDPRADWNPATNPDNRFTTPENNPLTISSSVLLANDKPGPANEADQTVNFVALSGDQGTTLGTFLTAKGGTVRVSGTDIIYTPKQSYNNTEGLDTFTYRITDGQAANQFATGTVTINVTEVNDPPVDKKDPVNPASKETVFPGIEEDISLLEALKASNWNRGPDNEASQTLKLYSFVIDPEKPDFVVDKADLFFNSKKIGEIRIASDNTFRYSIDFDETVEVPRTVNVKFFVRDEGKTGNLVSNKTAEGLLVLTVEPSKPSSIRGNVFLDTDADGIQDQTANGPIDSPIGGVEVSLFSHDKVDPKKLNHLRTEMTAADGSYDFYKLKPGTYTVSYNTPQHMVSAPGALQSRTITIDNKGGVNSVFNFSVQGIRSDYVSVLDYLVSASNPNNPSGRQGMHAAVDQYGVTEWVTNYGRPTGASFYEVVLSTDKTTAYLTEVSGDGERERTAVLGRRDFFWMNTSDGGHMIRIMKDPSSINTWKNIDASYYAEISAKTQRDSYLATVEKFFEQDEWAEVPN